MKGDTMKRDYLNNQKADIFLVGFKYKGYYYISTLTAQIFLTMAKYDKTSKSHGKKVCLRFKPTAWQKENMIKGYYGTCATCWGDELSLQRETVGRENRGQTFEKLMRNLWHGTPCVNRYWWNGGDFEYHYKIYQVKLENGTICTAEQCRKVRAGA